MHRLPMYIQILSFSFENDCTLEIIHEDLEAFFGNLAHTDIWNPFLYPCQCKSYSCNVSMEFIKALYILDVHSFSVTL